MRICWTIVIELIVYLITGFVIISAFKDYSKCPYNLDYWNIGQFSSLICLRLGSLQAQATIHNLWLRFCATVCISNILWCFAGLVLIIWIPLGLVWFCIIVFQSPKCTNVWNQVEMGSIIIITNLCLFSVIYILCKEFKNMIMHAFRRGDVTQELNDQIYETQLLDPNFDQNEYIEREQDVLDQLGFTEKELDLLKEKFTYKFKKTGNSVKIDEEKEGTVVNCDPCSICYSQFKNEDLVVGLPSCLHKYHYQCVKVWLEKKPICPICRSNARLGMLRELNNKPADWTVSNNK